MIYSIKGLAKVTEYGNTMLFFIKSFNDIIKKFRKRENGGMFFSEAILRIGKQIIVIKKGDQPVMDNFL
jgi:hypothetical protein